MSSQVTDNTTTKKKAPYYLSSMKENTGNRGIPLTKDR